MIESNLIFDLAEGSKRRFFQERNTQRVSFERQRRMKGYLDLSRKKCGEYVSRIIIFKYDVLYSDWLLVFPPMILGFRRI